MPISNKLKRLLNNVPVFRNEEGEIAAVRLSSTPPPWNCPR